MKYGGGSFFYRAGHFSITENLWKSDPGVIILYRIVTRGSFTPGSIFYMTPALSRRRACRGEPLGMLII